MRHSNFFDDVETKNNIHRILNSLGWSEKEIKDFHWRYINTPPKLVEKILIKQYLQ